MISIDKYIGCFLGLAAGDIFGAPYEGGVLEKLLWKLLGKTRTGKLRYTDDTQMSIDLAQSFLHNNCSINQQHLAQSFAASYHWSRGYGPAAAQLLKQINKGANWQQVNRRRYKDGSLGNGAAMRAPIIALCFPNSLQALQDAVIKCSEITHAHPLAIEGAQLIAWVTRSVLHGKNAQIIAAHLAEQSSSQEFQVKIAACQTLLAQQNSPPLRTIKQKLGNGMIATDSCVTTIYFALKYLDRPFKELLAEVLQIGGDVDTIAAMSCAIWGAKNGGEQIVPLASNFENDERIKYLAQSIFAAINPTAK